MMMMRFLTGFIFLLPVFQGFGQVFHVEDTSALIVKTVNQSPAHWYVEVFSDVVVDTALRWKATHFDNVPPEWEILMDDQSNSYTQVQPGDSADFALPANQAFARKLIIGAVLNGTPGHGICYFDVFDPDNPSFVQTISYEFIVTDGTNGLEEWNTESFLEWNAGFLRVKGEREADFAVYDLSGKLLKNERTNQLKISDLPENAISIIQVTLDSRLSIIQISR